MHLDCFWLPPLEIRPPKIVLFRGLRGVRFQDTSWKHLRSALGAAGSVFGPFLGDFWGFFGHSDGGTGQQNLFFFRLGRCSNDFLLSDTFQGGLWVVFRTTFCCFEMRFYLVRSSILRVL